MSPLVISIAAFIGVAALVGGVAFMMRGNADNEIDRRLSILTGKSTGQSRDGNPETSILTTSLEGSTGFIEKLCDRCFNFSRLFEQADINMTVPRFIIICIGCGTAGAAVGFVAGLNSVIIPIVVLMMGFIPVLWLIMRRRRRLKKFSSQLCDALELVARALRAGHSLAAGMNLVAHEMSEPISKEFGRVFEEQNLGIPLEEALENLTERVPNLDLRFFATAVILQRQTGGDLAEILDKIGSLIRERFKIWGQVQALTGEGRLSGIVLLALPPALFVAVYKMNPDYVMLLFTDDMGKKMLIGGAIMQLLGALVIRKIVNIRV
ncbi:MAG: type II secretion system F family protein [Pirellulales bacterium]|nr:type II secretion system F family protein [Pirellulales bacterium]